MLLLSEKVLFLFVFLILCLFLSKKFTLSEMSIVSEMECFFFLSLLDFYNFGNINQFIAYLCHSLTT